MVEGERAQKGNRSGGRSCCRMPLSHRCPPSITFFGAGAARPWDSTETPGGGALHRQISRSDKYDKYVESILNN